MTISRPAGSETVDPLEQTLARCKQGDAEAFRRLVDRYQRYAYTLAFRVVCDEESARDVVQESFIRVWRHIAEYDPRVKFTTWLYKIVVHLAYDVLKREASSRKVFIPHSRTEAPHEESADDSLLGEIANRDLAAQISELVVDLPLKQRLVFVMRDLQDLDVDEVAEILGISKAAVKTNLCYAREYIRRKLAARMKEGDSA